MQKRFQAKLESIHISIPGVIVRLPFDPVKAWPERVKLRVKGSIRGTYSGATEHAFHTSLIRSNELGYFLLVTQKMRKAAEIKPGDRVEVVLEPDVDDRAATPPPELAKFFKEDRALKKWFETLNYSMRKYIADSVVEPKSAEGRERRAEQWAERLMLVMDGEAEPPPVLQLAFRRQPLAREGWSKLTANQRRQTLIGIFMCASPEAQAKRVEYALADAMKAANRSEHGKSGRAKPERTEDHTQVGRSQPERLQLGRSKSKSNLNEFF